jgi:hypothetical protein
MKFNNKHIITLSPPSVEIRALDGILARGLDLVGSVTGHKVVRWEVAEGHKQVLRGDADPRKIKIPGGWLALAEKIGLSRPPDAVNVRAIVITQAHCCFNLPHGLSGNLLTYQESQAVGQRQAHVDLVLGDALLPHYLYVLREKLGEASRSAQEAQKLVPMTDIPPLVGRPNEHGQQATLSMLITREMRLHARELVKHNGILLPLDRWADLARQAGLPARLLGAVIDRWTQDGPDAPAFLKRVECDRYTLGDTHGSARDFLVEAGKKEITQSERGKRSVEARAKGQTRRAASTPQKARKK